MFFLWILQNSQESTFFTEHLGVTASEKLFLNILPKD